MIFNKELKKDIEAVSREVKQALTEIKTTRIRTKKQIAALNARLVIVEGYMKTIATSMVAIAKQLEDHSKTVEKMFGDVIKEKSKLEEKSTNAVKLIQDAMDGILDSGNLGVPK